MMAERALSVAHTTIMRWIQRYVPEFERRWNRFTRPAGVSTVPSTKRERPSISCCAPSGTAAKEGILPTSFGSQGRLPHKITLDG